MTPDETLGVQVFKNRKKGNLTTNNTINKIF